MSRKETPVDPDEARPHRPLRPAAWVLAIALGLVLFGVVIAAANAATVPRQPALLAAH